jgi:hypothetical protein
MGKKQWRKNGKQTWRK